MLKFLQKMLLIAALCVPWVTQAQNCTPISTFPVTYGFEASEGFTTTVTAAAACTTNVFNNCWRNEQTTFNGSTGSGRIWHIYGGTTATYLHSGAHSLMLPDKGSTTAGVSTTMLTFPAMNFTNPGGYIVTFWIQRNGTSTNPEGFKIYVSDTDTIGPNAVELGHYSRNRGIAYPCIESATGWYQYETAPITMTGTVYIIFEGQSYYGSSTYVDDITIMETPTCFKVSDLAIDATQTTTNSLTLTWNDTINSGATYSIYSFTATDTTLVQSGVTDTFYTVTGLNPATYYTFGVVTDCGSGDTSMFSSFVSAYTACATLTANDLPYVEDFESYGTGSASPIDPCWHKGVVALTGSGTTTNFPYPYSTAAIHGSRGLYFYAATTSSTSYYNWMALPPIDASLNMSDLMITFNMKRTSTSSHQTKLVVGVTTDYTSTAGFVPVDTIDLSSQAVSSIHNIEVSFANYTGTGTYVLFYAPAPTMTGSTAVYNAFYVDDIVLREIPSCFWPTSVELVSSGTNDAVISWTPDPRTSNPSSWSVEYGEHGFTPGEGATVTAYDTTVTLTNLMGSTQYDVYVRANCNGELSDATSCSFYTQCDLLTNLPYTENFDGITGSTATSGMANILPNCWDYYNDGTRANYQGCPYVYSSTTYSHSGSNCIRFYSYNTSGDSNQYLILPLTDSTVYHVNQMMLSFWLRGNSTSSTYHNDVVVGVMTNPNVESSFIPVTTITSQTTVYEQHEIEFSAYTGPHGNVTLMFPKPTTSSSYEYGYVDDVVLAPLPECPSVQNLTVDSLSVDWASVSWFASEDATSWIIEYDTVDFVPGSGNAANTDGTFDPNYLMANLDTGYTYYVYVRANCGNDTSAFSSITVTTLASVPAIVPYTCDFEGNLTNGWELVQTGQTNYWTVGTATNNGGSKSMYVTDNGTTNNYSGSESYSFATRTFNLTEAGEYAYSYDWKCNGESSYDFLRVALVPVSTTITAGSYCGFNNGEAPSGSMPTGGIPLDGQGRLNLNSSWQTRTGTFTITTPGAYKWVFLWRNDGSVYNQPPAAIDNISLVRNTCPAPYNLVATHLTTDSIVVSWQTVGSETSWLISNGVDTFTVNDTTYAFEYLNASTTYTISVRALCDGGDTSMPVIITAATSCAYANLPIIEDFDALTGSTATSGMANILPNCWDYYNDGTRTNYQGCPYVYSSTTYAHSGSNCIRFYSYNSSGDSNQYLILPPVDPQDYQISDLQLSFWLRGYSTSSNYFANVVVGVMTDPTVESSFIPYDTITYSSTTYAYFEVNFNHYTGPNGRVTMLFPKPLSSSQYEYGYVDDVTLGPIPTCISVDNLTSVYTATDSIILSWVPGGTETEWEVTYGSNSIIVNDTFCVVTPLSPNTEYTFNVRAICSVGDTSYPVSYSTRTDCGAISVLPYFESFEGLPTGASANLDCGIPCYGRLDNASQYHFGYIGSPSSWPSGGHTGSGFIYYYMPTTTGTYADWILTILPSIDVTTYPINTLQVSFWVKMNSATTSGDIQVGVISNTDADSTFVPLDTVHVSGNVYELKTAYLSGYTGTGSNIALKFLRNPSTTTYYFVDDITVELIPDCPPVTNINVTSITSDSLYVTWTENGSATSWNVEYGPSGFTLGTGTTDVVTTLPYAIGNLTSNTAYDVYVTPECTSGTSATRMGTFITGCTPFSVPFTESFDTWSSTAADPLPNCWEKHTNYSTNYPYASTSYGHSGGKSMYMYSTSTTYSYMVLPQFDLPIDSTMISFWLYKSNTSYAHKLLVGVMTNPADVSTFVQVAEVVPTLTSTWEEFEVPLSSYTGTGTRIAIMSPNNEYSYPYLDDLSVNVISGCQRVVDLSATSVLLDSATIVWADGINTSWYVEYDTVDFTPGVGTGHNMTMVTDTFCVLSGLDSGTVYHVYVYPNCDTTIADRHITFTTLAAAPATVPYSCDFEQTGVNGWDLIQAGQNNYWVVGNATNNGGTQSLYITDNGTANSYSGAASYSFAVRTFNLPAGNYVCTYDWKGQGESSFDFLRAALVPAGVNIEAGNYCGFDNASAMPAGSIALDGGYRLNLQGSSWQSQVTEFTLTSAGTYKIVFLWRNDGSVYNQPPAAIDNVQLMLNLCPMPQNITLANLTQTSVDVSWEEPGNATTWEYQLDNNTPVIAYDTFCTLTGLTANTVYSFHVRSICGQGDTGAWATYSFRTPCGYMTLPYTEDLENEATGSSSTGSAFVNCWNRLNNGTSYGGYPYVSSSSTYNHTPGGSKGFYWYNSTTAGTYGDYQCVVLPPVDPSVGVDSLQISFWAKASSASYIPIFQIGVMTDPNNISTFVGVDTITLTTGTAWTNIEVPLSTYTGNGQYVAVKADRGTSAWYAYVDDFTLEYTPTCLNPRNVVSTDATSTSITLDWTDLDQPTSWEIRYVQNGVTHSVFTNSHPYTVTGLDALTAYHFEVRAICGVGDTSTWSLEAALSTAMCDNAVVVMNYDSTMTSGTSTYSPIGYSFYNYGYTQVIIDSAFLVDLTGEINALAFEPTVTTAGDKFQNMTVYLANVPEDNLTSGWILPDTTDHIFVKVIDNGDFCYTTTGQKIHGFDTTFTWDGHSNILVSVVRNNGSYTSGATFAAHTHSVAKARYVYRDSPGGYNYLSPEATGTAITTVGDLYLISCGAGCAKPSLLPVTDLSYNAATINWNSNATDFEVAVRAATEAEYPAPTSVTGATSYTVSGLQPATIYRYQVRAICDATEELISDWVEGTFTTDSLPCFAPTDLHTSDLGYTTATLAWTAGGAETMWNIHVWNTSKDTNFTATGNPYTVTGLAQTTSYYAAISALCGNGTVESEYSDTIQFTTATCAVPTAVTTGNITATTVTVSWNGSAQSYEIEYGDRNFNRGEGTKITVNGTTHQITGLESDHMYTLYVRAICEAGIMSDYSSQVDFDTPAGEGFDAVNGGMNVSIYPNPTTSATTIALSGVNGEVSITIVDMNGRIVMSDSMSCEGDCTKTMEVSGLAQGAYFVRLNGDNVNMVKKLVVK